jgi:putative NADPH-quinone reductase
MKHLVVAAHPAEGSFTMGLARAYAAELEQLGHSQRTCDLYRMGFNPILAAHELVPASADHPVGPRHTIDEPGEQRRAIFGGAWGEKGAGQGEHRSI